VPWQYLNIWHQGKNEKSAQKKFEEFERRSGGVLEDYPAGQRGVIGCVEGVGQQLVDRDYTLSDGQRGYGEQMRGRHSSQDIDWKGTISRSCFGI
jgi:hypothetical protein